MIPSASERASASKPGAHRWYRGRRFAPLPGPEPDPAYRPAHPPPPWMQPGHERGPGRTRLCTSLWTTCAETARICAQRGDNVVNLGEAARPGMAVTWAWIVHTLCKT